jgi:KTSC domain
MNWIDTPDSSNISRFRYMSESSTLEIEFKKGGLISTLKFRNLSLSKCRPQAQRVSFSHRI